MVFIWYSLRNTLENLKNIHQKCTENCVKFVLYACPNFPKNLQKFAQKSTKTAPKIDQNWSQIGLLGGSWGDHVACFVFCCFSPILFPPLGGILEPTWHQVGPKLGQVGGKLGQVGAKMRHVGAKLAQVGAKVAQVGAKMEPTWASRRIV